MEDRLGLGDMGPVLSSRMVGSAHNWEGGTRRRDGARNAELWEQRVVHLTVYAASSVHRLTTSVHFRGRMILIVSPNRDETHTLGWWSYQAHTRSGHCVAKG